MKRRIFAVLMAVVMVLSLSVCSYASNTVVKSTDVKLSVDGKAVNVPAGRIWVSEDGYTMVAARDLAEAVGGTIKWDSATRTAQITGLTKAVGTYSPAASLEHLVLAATYQMSAEAHALMMQAFNIAKRNVDEMVAKAKAGQDGFTLTGGKLFKDGKRVAVISDIDDTLVDGVHYTANIVGKNGDWNNAAFTRFILSDGCTALPGAVDFVKYCVDNGIEFFYLTNRYDQAYKAGQKDSKGGYAGKDGYVVNGKVVGDSVYDVFGQTLYDISYESMRKLGFPLNDDAHLIVNDLKINGSSKEGVRQTIANGGTQFTGERVEESKKHPKDFTVSEHYVAMLCGDDLNDISDIFSASGVDAVGRVKLAIDNEDKWGAEWIVLPNGVYGSSYNYASSYGFGKLLDYFDYTKDTEAWNLYK